ncbi:hypothetical protein [Methanobrevibacter sp.]|uniref:hypothetical protein n=1 Tax=Methanobrevibacter sp. TaxID=66852 RepID=UPI00388DF6F6
MGNTIKLVSGFILFVIGVLIAYEATAYNLLDLLIAVGGIIAIIGFVLIISYFLDSSADRTTNKIKEFLQSNEFNPGSFAGFERKSSNPDRPLKVRQNYDDYSYDDGDEYEYDGGYEELDVEDYETPSPRSFLRSTVEDNPKAVLNVVNQPETEVNFDKQLDFVPHYDKPLKVTRAPKKREQDYFTEEIPPFVVEETDKTNEIKRVLSEEPVIEETVEVKPEIQDLTPPRDIKIDLNDPESLPIPKSLNSFVIYNGGLVTSKEAFDELAVNVNKEIMLEIPSLNDLSDRFLSHVPTIYSRVIIDEFDVSDMSYMFLISSLLRQGVHIRTVPKVHTVNLITDDSHAMIISEGQNDLEYGAIYDDRSSISDIRSNFEKTWSIASNLDENILMNSMAGGNA